MPIIRLTVDRNFHSSPAKTTMMWFPLRRVYKMKNQFIAHTSSVFTCTLVLLSASSAMADSEKVPLFKAGTYELVSGMEKSCGDGLFYLSDDGKFLWLGPFYNFPISSTQVSSKGDRPDQNCQKNSVTSMTAESKKSELSRTTTIDCGSSGVEVNRTIATITKQEVTLRQTIEGTGNRGKRNGGSGNYCVWRMKK